MHRHRTSSSLAEPETLTNRNTKISKVSTDLINETIPTRLGRVSQVIMAPLQVKPVFKRMSKPKWHNPRVQYNEHDEREAGNQSQEQKTLVKNVWVTKHLAKGESEVMLLLISSSTALNTCHPS